MKSEFFCLRCGGPLLKNGSHDLACGTCGATYPLLEDRVPVLLPTKKQQESLGIGRDQQLSLIDVQQTYDRVYSHDGLMGTDLDGDYDQTTKEILLSFAEPLKHKRILDVGTGIGKLWDYLQVPVEAYALDVSLVGVLKAMKRHPQLVGSVSIAEYLPYQADFFDVVVAADTIEHTFVPERALEEIYRTLKPGGVFSGSFPIPDSLRKWGWNTFVCTRPSLRMFARLIWVLGKRILLFGRPDFQPLDRDYGKEKWIQMIKDVGFQIETFVSWPESPKIPITYLVKAVKD